MSGLQFNIDQDFQYGIKLITDPRINNGSIVLLEPARDSTVGIPSTIANYAVDEFKAITGIEVPSVAVKNTLASVGGVAERTAKGGLHGIYPQNLTSENPRGVLSGLIPDAVKDYIMSNTSHAFYMSLMGVITRNAITGAGNAPVLAGLYSGSDGTAAAQVTPCVYQSIGTGTVAGGRTGSDMLGRTTASPNTPFCVDVAQSKLVLTSSSSMDSVKGELFTIGNISTSVYAGCPSWVLYSLYIEDLTVSGQTYAQASAKSQEVYNSRFGQGGMYAGDTWAPPT